MRTIPRKFKQTAQRSPEKHSRHTCVDNKRSAPMFSYKTVKIQIYRELVQTSQFWKTNYPHGPLLIFLFNPEKNISHLK